MDPADLFALSSPVAMIGWLALALSPLAPRAAQAIAGLAIPALLGIAYTALIFVGWSGAEGGFDSLANVTALFDDPTVALAGWLHYLAFDLFVGAWEVRIARAERIPHVLVLPCLALTFLSGPAGLILFLGLRVILPLVRTPAQRQEA